MAPTIVLDANGDVELLIGAAGGSKITSSIAYVRASCPFNAEFTDLTILCLLSQVMFRYLYFNETITEALAAKRIHHQLFPMNLVHEPGLAQDIVDRLRQIGHVMQATSLNSGFSSVTAISCKSKHCVPAYDPRRGGGVAVLPNKHRI